MIRPSVAAKRQAAFMALSPADRQRERARVNYYRRKIDDERRKHDKEQMRHGV